MKDKHRVSNSCDIHRSIGYRDINIKGILKGLEDTCVGPEDIAGSPMAFTWEMILLCISPEMKWSSSNNPIAGYIIRTSASKLGSRKIMILPS